MNDNELQVLREQIDVIDAEVIKLLNERYKAVEAIGEYKRERHLPVYDPARQRKLMERLESLNHGPMTNDILHAVYREIMSGAQRLERPLKAAFLGPLGTFSHQATLGIFGSSAELVPEKTIPEVFRAIECGRADYGCVPIENSAEGVINYTLDHLVRTSVRITAEKYCKVHHSLMAKCKRDEIKRIYTHPQVLGQCRSYLLGNFPRAELVEMTSTAAAAERAAAEEFAATLGSPVASELYNLSILEENVEDSSFNTTRFLVLGNQLTKRSGDDKTSLCFVVKNRPGALYEALEPFRRAKLQMTMIESRPWQQQEGWEYCFFVDLLGHRDDANIADACADVEKLSAFFKILGSYPRMG
ncbi:MAG: prephenate dehydratase [Lentisphaerae bacterium]|nr:prephenate dehydratase [Lentisphaerota bacterium]